jgi:drug/metabolite transporter (DMT)-like permease
MTSKPASTPFHVYALMLFGTFVGAWAPIFGRFAQQEGVSTPVLIASRMILGVLLFAPWVLARHWRDLMNIEWKDLMTTAITGLWMSIHLLAGFEALQHTTILVTNVVGATLPIWIAILEVRILRTRLSRSVWMGLVISLIGGIIFALSGTSDRTLGNNPLLGIILGLVAALAGAIYAIVGRNSRNHISLTTYLWLVFASGAICCTALVAIQRHSFVGYSPEGYFHILALTISAQIIGHGVYNFVLRRLPATFTAVSGQLGSVIAPILAYIFFREVPSLLQIPGAITMLTGIIVVNLGRASETSSQTD